jgi:site-specific DNA recombinase
VVVRSVELDPALDEAQVTMTLLDAIWDQLFPTEQQRIVRLGAATGPEVIVSPNDIEVRLRQTGIEELAIELRPAMPEEVAA